MVVMVLALVRVYSRVSCQAGVRGQARVMLRKGLEFALGLECACRD